MSTENPNPNDIIKVYDLEVSDGRAVIFDNIEDVLDDVRMHLETNEMIEFTIRSYFMPQGEFDAKEDFDGW